MKLTEYKLVEFKTKMVNLPTRITNKAERTV